MSVTVPGCLLLYLDVGYYTGCLLLYVDVCYCDTWMSVTIIPGCLFTVPGGLFQYLDVRGYGRRCADKHLFFPLQLWRCLCAMLTLKLPHPTGTRMKRRHPYTS